VCDSSGQSGRQLKHVQQHLFSPSLATLELVYGPFAPTLAHPIYSAPSNSICASRPDLRRCTTKPRLKQHDQPTLRRMTRWHIIHLSTPRTDGARQCIATTSVQPRTARRTFPKPHCASSSEANCHTVRAEEEWRRSKRSADQPSGGYEPRPRGSYHGSSARAPTGESPCDLVISNQAAARSPSKITFLVRRV